jgi:catechol 2,3-dioxygenase-like lactoylglutathione lyase family enzyme
VKSSLGHIGLNLSSAGEPFAFWKDLLSFIGFEMELEEEGHFDAGDGHTTLCVKVTRPDRLEPPFHRSRTGLNHIAFQLGSAVLVDAFTRGFLRRRGIEPLYGGPKAYPDYNPGYYAVFFEDPDRIKVEVYFGG